VTNNTLAYFGDDEKNHQQSYETVFFSTAVSTKNFRSIVLGKFLCG